MIIKNGNVYTNNFIFEKKNIRIADGIITAVEDKEIIPFESEEVIDADNLMVIPGLTDVHFHGCVGYDFCDATDEAITSMAKFQMSKGVTSICPATMTLPKDRIRDICKVAASHKQQENEADLVGINLEGPFISPNKCGAQNPEYVQKADADFLLELIEISKGLTKLITIAPEEEGAIDCIKQLKDKITFSVGHTTADFDAAYMAFNAGAKHITHMYNAMPALTHRAPGVIGAAADNENVMAEIICDGIHVHPSAVRAAFKLFGEDRIVLISDSTRACGMPEGEYELGGLPVFLKDGAVRLEDGTLAGSSTNLFDCMVNVIKMGVPREVAIKAATYNPAKAIDILERCGTIEYGKEGKVVLLDKDYDIVKVIK